MSLYSLNPYEINARNIGHQQRISWLNRLPVIFVNPAYSSKTCHACSQIARRNKHSLVCNCGNRAHSDLNVSRNIARLGETAVSSRVIIDRSNVAAGSLV